jgi:hypothetical protein
MPTTTETVRRPTRQHVITLPIAYCQHRRVCECAHSRGIRKRLWHHANNPVASRKFPSGSAIDTKRRLAACAEPGIDAIGLQSRLGANGPELNAGPVRQGCKRQGCKRQARGVRRRMRDR